MRRMFSENQLKKQTIDNVNDAIENGEIELQQFYKISVTIQDDDVWEGEVLLWSPKKELSSAEDLLECIPIDNEIPEGEDSLYIIKFWKDASYINFLAINTSSMAVGNRTGITLVQ